MELEEGGARRRRNTASTSCCPIPSSRSPKPVIATVAVFQFLQTYNDFLQPLIYINSRKNWTLALGLQPR